MNFRKILILFLLLILLLIVIFLIFNNKSLEEENMDNIELKNTIVVIETSLGDITLELFDERAPITVQNFKQYIESNFYNETVFHRVIDGFMIQGGGFTFDGNQKQTINPIILESTDKTELSNLKGTIAMARTMDPNSATSQFFINTVDNNFLNYTNPQNPGYAVFGKVIDGMDIVLEIENKETTTKFEYHNDWPVKDIIIKRIYIK